MAGGPRDLGKKKKREKEKLDHHVVERDKQLAALVEEHNVRTLVYIDELVVQAYC